MAKINGVLAGKKKVVAAVLAVLGVVAAFLTGDVELGTAITELVTDPTIIDAVSTVSQ